MISDTKTERRLKVLLRHIDNVRSACLILGERLMAKGEVELGLKLIKNGYKHDNSKFSGIEWDYLNGDVETDDKEKLEMAIKHHGETNPHHPEYWGNIDNMPRIFLAEMVCDWYSRSNEFGSDVREWVKDKATKRFEFTVQSKVYRQIKEFLDILLDPSFK